MKHLTIIIFLFASMSIFAQNTYVPDDNFEQALIDLGYDAVLDDYIPTANISGITTLDISNQSINDLTGIEGFTTLSDLNCSMNFLTNIDVTQNTVLTSLNFNDNSISYIDLSQNNILVSLSCIFNQLTDLDIRNNNNSNLTYFKASENSNLTCIYVDDKDASFLTTWIKDASSSFVENESQCYALYGYTFVPDNNFEQAIIDIGVDTEGLSDNKVLTSDISGITSLDVSNKNIADLTGIEDFIALIELHCEVNQLTNLDISQNISLTDLVCYSNQLTSLDLSQNTALSVLGCNSNQLTSLDVSQNVSLTILSCYMNQLTSIDLRNGNNENMTEFFAMDNPHLTCIFVDDAIWSEANWSNIEPISTFIETEVQCNDLYTYVPDDNFEQDLIISGYDTVLDDFVPTANISGIYSLSVGSKNISDLTGIEDFVSLTSLNCYQNQLASLDLSQNTLLLNISCFSNLLTSLDVTSNTALTSLHCNDNQLTNLNVRNNNNTNLIEFYAENNPNLTCIFVDDATWSEANWTNTDPASTFVETEAECEGLAVDDIFQETNFIIYPNPAKEKISVQTNNEVEHIEIYDVLGKLLKIYNKQETYSVSDLAPGIYLIRAQSNIGSQISKLIIE